VIQRAGPCPWGRACLRGAEAALIGCTERPTGSPELSLTANRAGAHPDAMRHSQNQAGYRKRMFV